MPSESFAGVIVGALMGVGLAVLIQRNQRADAVPSAAGGGALSLPLPWRSWAPWPGRC
jgi:hypothetical protein